MITYLGELSVSATIPLLATANLQLGVALGFGLPELTAKLAGLGSVLAAITITPPDLTATISAAIATVAALEASFAGPTVTLQAAALIALIAELNVQLGMLNVGFDFAAELAALLGVFGIHAFAYSGTVGAMGSEIGSALAGGVPGGGGPGQSANALTLVAVSPAVWAAMSAVLKVSL